MTQLEFSRLAKDDIVMSPLGGLFTVLKVKDTIRGREVWLIGPTKLTLTAMMAAMWNVVRSDEQGP